MEKRMIAVVTQTDKALHMARVRDPISGANSDWLYIVRTSEIWMPNIGDSVLVEYLDAEDGDGIILGVIE